MLNREEDKGLLQQQLILLMIMIMIMMTPILTANLTV
jgi:hypothetical protein